MEMKVKEEKKKKVELEKLPVYPNSSSLVIGEAVRRECSAADKYL